ncbi:MAG: DUF3798 domain-containing protein [Clostridia bacterium]|nr:DUF3798 domain-containing protein [Clostridia bacterium]MBR3819101.1 DUF3798 domain-containing protein [Clostridia bacterium]
MKKSLFSKIISVILIFVLVFSFAACKDNKTEKITEPEKKVAILVAPEAQYPEDYKAAQELAAEHPEKVIVKEYSDSRILRAGDPEIMQFSKELASDPEIGAIIYARATQFTTNAIREAEAANPEIVTICIEPEESIETVSSLANLVFCADWAKVAADAVAAAKAQGAEQFVVFSINRHITNNPMYTSLNTAFKNECEAQGLKYVYDNSVDPIYSSGIKGAKLYIRESVARLYNNEKISGTNVALFSTDSSVQSTLIEVANERGLIYVCPSFPTAYNGLGEVYEIAKPEKISDIKTYIENAKTASTEGKAKLSMYNFPLAATLLKSALYCAFDILNGTTTAENFAEKVQERTNTAADNKEFTIAPYGELTNAFMAYCPGFEVVK